MSDDKIKPGKGLYCWMSHCDESGSISINDFNDAKPKLIDERSDHIVLFGTDTYDLFEAEMRGDKEKVSEITNRMREKRLISMAGYFESFRKTMSDDEFLAFCEITTTYGSNHYMYTTHPYWRIFLKVLNNDTDLVIDISLKNKRYTIKVGVVYGWMSDSIEAVTVSCSGAIKIIDDLKEKYKDYE